MFARISIIGLLLTCLGCGSHTPVGLWYYTYSEGLSENRDTLMSAASFLALRSDGSYTRDFGNFEYGTWNIQGRILQLTNQHHMTHALPFSLGEDLRMSSYAGQVAHFARNPLPADGSSADPFALGANRWRLPAQHKESDAEIRQRLLNHCQFWEAYFGWALKYNIDNVDVRSTPTPIKIWGNGFTLKPFAGLPMAWKLYFYDEDDCRRANEMLKDIFENRTISWAHTENKFEMFMGAFQQMEQFLH